MEPFTYQHDERHIRYMREQIWEAKHALGVYGATSLHEFEQIAEYIGQPKTVLEVGCGLGRGSIFLNHLLRDDTVLYVLADRTGYTPNSGAFAPDTDEYYNDLALTEDFCRLNGIVNLRTFDTEIDDWTTLPKADLIFSLCSFGMHVPIERYMDRLIAAASPEATMIFGTRSPIYTSDSFRDRFDEVIVLAGRKASGLPEEDWLILRGPKVV